MDRKRGKRRIVRGYESLVSTSFGRVVEGGMVRDVVRTRLGRSLGSLVAEYSRLGSQRVRMGGTSVCPLLDDSRTARRDYADCPRRPPLPVSCQALGVAR